MVYDANASDQYVVLFGGEGPAGPLGDTWVFQNEAWSNLTPTSPSATNTPSPRFGAAMAYDSEDGYVILFGGATGAFTGSNHPLLNDTWKFLHGVWTPLCTTCTAGVNEPGPRLEGAASDDSSEGGVVLFGGLTIEAGAFAPLNDTWVFSNGAWTQLSPATSPPRLYGAGMAFNSTTGPLVLYGGCAGALPTGEPTCTKPLADDWTFSAGTWTNASVPSGPPGARANFGFAASSVQSDLVVFGGASSSGLLNQTWELANGTWTNLTDSLLWSPSAREESSLAYDNASGANYFLLFGGWNGTYLGETWVYPSLFSPLRVGTPVATPRVLDAGLPLQMNVTVQGGVPYYSVTWLNLPQGCVTSNTTGLVCRPLPPVIVFSKNYSVTVRVRDAIGSIVWSPVTVVEVNALPTVAVTAVTSNVGIIPWNLTLDAVVVSGGTPPFVFNWTFGDGTNGTGTTVTHEYTAAGDFLAHVSGHDSLGVPYVGGGANQSVISVRPLTVQLGVKPTSVSVGSQATFEALVAGGYPAYTYYWSGLPPFCAPPDKPIVTCTAYSAGTIVASVNVVDLLHESAKASLTLVVSPSSGVSPSILIWVLVIVPGGAALIAAVWVLRRSRKPPRSSPSPSAGPAESPPST